MSSKPVTKEYLRKITQSILNLPTLPTVVAKIIEVMDNPKTTAKMLGKLIEEDQVLTAKLLKMSNSAYYSFSREINTVDAAIVMLGFDNVKEISLGVSVLNTFKSAQSQASFDINKFWDHSVTVGTVARMLARMLFPDVQKEAFVGGLIHDIGKVILIQYLTADFERILGIARQEGIQVFQAEIREFGVDHGLIGFWLAEKWKLPMALRNTMRYHHHPWDAKENQNLIACVYLANILTQSKQPGFSGNGSLPVIDERFWIWAEEQGELITREKLEQIMPAVNEEIEKAVLIREQMVS